MFVQLRKRGDAYFRKCLEPFTEDAAVAEHFDPLEYLLKQAHEYRIEVHAWLSVLPVWRTEDPLPKHADHLLYRHGLEATGEDHWLSCNERGACGSPAGYFLDPGHPQVPDYLVNVVTELLRHYPVDGIHLDQIRYASQNNHPTEGFGVGYNPASVARFNQRYERSGLPHRNDALWSTWRQEQVTALVRRLSTAIKQLKPQVCLSAALVAWGDAPRDAGQWNQSMAQCKVFQNWLAWMREGLIDLAMPMNYFQNTSSVQRAYFQHWLQFQLEYCVNTRLAFGLGAFVNDACGLEQQLGQIGTMDTAQREHGVAFFSYASLFNQNPAGKVSWSELVEILRAVGPRQ